MSRIMKRNASRHTEVKIAAALIAGLVVGAGLATVRQIAKQRRQWMFHIQPADGVYYVNISSPQQSYTIGPFSDRETAWNEANTYITTNGGEPVWAGGV